MSRKIPLESIIVGIHRLRELRPNIVDDLAESMADQGLLHPIVVRRYKGGDYCLVAGWHRFEAAKKLKWVEINCTVLDDIEADKAELIEIEENLIRSNLSDVEESRYLARSKELYEKLHGKAKAKGAHAANEKMGKTNDASDNLSDAYTTHVAKKTGQTARNIRRKIARNKTVTAFPEIVGTALGKGREIDALAKLPPEKQRSLVEAARRGEKVSAITERSACDLEDPKTSDDTEEIELAKVIARLRHEQRDNPDIMRVCDALERRLKLPDDTLRRAVRSEVAHHSE
jgi:ParB family chromosome partitioning protein